MVTTAIMVLPPRIGLLVRAALSFFRLNELESGTSPPSAAPPRVPSWRRRADAPGRGSACASNNVRKMSAPERRFPPPWTVEDIGAAFVVMDSAGQKPAYIYYEEEPGRRSAAKLLSRDEARRIAANVAKLPSFIESSRK